MQTILKEEGYPLALLESYMAMVEGSVGSAQWRHLYVRREEDALDVIDDGDLACAYYVSSILHTFNLIDGGVHTTVVEIEHDLLQSGWSLVEEPCPGAIVFWGEKMGDDGRVHRHLGICTSDCMAVHHDAKTKSPKREPIWSLVDHSGNQRPVEKFYFHPLLEE